MKRPKILLTCPETKKDKNISLTCNHLYITAIEKAGGIPILSDPSYKDMIDELIEISQGILLTGGGDILPSLYKEEKEPPTKGIDLERDNFEISVLKKSVEKGIPVLGICRGIQIINVAYGGSLYQDLPQHTYNKNHTVTIKGGSFLEKLFHKRDIEVNSYHHQGIKRVAEPFDVIAKTEDNIIEAIILKDDKKFVLGVQWHPERMYDAFKPLFEEFVKLTKEG